MSQSRRLRLAAGETQTQQAAQGRANNTHARTAFDYGLQSESVLLDSSGFDTP